MFALAFAAAIGAGTSLLSSRQSTAKQTQLNDILSYLEEESGLDRGAENPDRLAALAQLKSLPLEDLSSMRAAVTALRARPRVPYTVAALPPPVALPSPLDADAQLRAK